MGATYNCKVLVANVRVRPENSTSNTSTGTIYKDYEFQISEILSDMDDPSNINKKWGRIFGGTYGGQFTALEYPSNGVPTTNSSYIPIIDTDPDPSPETEIAETIDVVYHFSTGDVIKKYVLGG